MKASLNYINLKTFANNVEIEGFDNNNTTILNDLSEEELEEFLTTIYEKMGFSDNEEDEKYYNFNINQGFDDEDNETDEDDTTDDYDEYTTDTEKATDEGNAKPININQF